MTMAAASTRDTECSECSTHHCSAVHPSALTVSGVPPWFVDHLLVSTVLSLPQIGVHALLWAAKKLLVMSHTNVDNWYTLVSVSSVRLMATLEC